MRDGAASERLPNDTEAALISLGKLAHTLSSPAGILSLSERLQEALGSLCELKKASLIVRGPDGKWREWGAPRKPSCPDPPLPLPLWKMMQTETGAAIRSPLQRELHFLPFPLSSLPDEKETIQELWIPLLGVTERAALLHLESVFPRFPLPEFMAGLFVLSGLLRHFPLLEADPGGGERTTLVEGLEAGSARFFTGISPIVGKSQKMQQIFESIQKVSRTNASVLLRGESGTGKELVARAIHQLSSRRDRPFAVINCAALPETLIESELFGHERGSFTGAVTSREGRFEQADGGTIFLDEIGEINRQIQVKLLRFLQERKFERVGGKKTLSVDVRIIAATNRNLEAAVAEGHFREDLYYRLNVVPIYLPPLRERKEDIPLLVGHFLSRFNAENGKRVKLSSAAMDVIMGYPWPGNVRELENCIERIVIMAEREVVSPEEVALPWGHFESMVPAEAIPPAPQEPPQPTLAEVEKRQIEEALRKTGGIQARAARLLGITQRQIGYKIKKFGIRLPRPLP